MRVKLTVAYDGTDFSGWQRQDNGPSVQQTLEEALAEMTGAPTPVRGAGRTDAGVHAAGQVAHFDTEARIPLEGFRRGLTGLLPRSIAILDAAEAAPEFDARFSARGKLYRYSIWNGRDRDPLRDRYSWHLMRPLDVDAMRRAARPLWGRHDFAAFRAADCERRTTVRHILRLDVLVPARGEVTIEVEADALLKNMVRILAGTLVDVGRGRLAEHSTGQILEGLDRRKAGVTAPAHGLCLVRVDYDRPR